MHGAHCRSTVELPAVLMPCPTAQVDHAVHVSTAVVLVLALNVPAAQSAHVRSREAVAVTFVYAPAAHTALTAAQAPPSAVAE